MRTVVSLGLEVNALADGFFHSATWVLVLAASIAAITAWTVSIQNRVHSLTMVLRLDFRVSSPPRRTRQWC
jgi:low affinity Fe/Cu permease